MVPLGLKETKDIDFFEQFSDFILEHYSVDPSNFEDAILDLIDTRQVRGSSMPFGARVFIERLFKATRTPTRDENGVDLLCKYYNLLYYAERRFFPADRNIGLYFEWYDSLTGKTTMRRFFSQSSQCYANCKHMALQFVRVVQKLYFFKVSRRVKKPLH